MDVSKSLIAASVADFVASYSNHCDGACIDFVCKRIHRLLNGCIMKDIGGHTNEPNVVLLQKNEFYTVRYLDEKYNIDANTYDPNGIRYVALCEHKMNSTVFYPEEYRKFNIYLVGPFQRAGPTLYLMELNDMSNAPFDLLRTKPDCGSPLALVWWFARFRRNGKKEFFEKYPSTKVASVQHLFDAFGHESSNITTHIDFEKWEQYDGSNIEILAKCCTDCVKYKPCECIEQVTACIRVCAKLKLDMYAIITCFLVSHASEGHLHLWKTLITDSDARFHTRHKNNFYQLSKHGRNCCISFEQMQNKLQHHVT